MNTERKWYQMKRTWAGVVFLLFVFILSTPDDNNTSVQDNYVPPVKNTASVVESIEKDIAETSTRTQDIKVVQPEVKGATKSNFSEVTPPKQPSCHPSYSGCLNPNASDYDCEGGSGNGPYYTGAVRVIGPDVFGLDRDKDGWGCE